MWFIGETLIVILCIANTRFLALGRAWYSWLKRLEDAIISSLWLSPVPLSSRSNELLMGGKRGRCWRAQELGYLSILNPVANWLSQPQATFSSQQQDEKLFLWFRWCVVSFYMTAAWSFATTGTNWDHLYQLFISWPRVDYRKVNNMKKGRERVQFYYQQMKFA